MLTLYRHASCPRLNGKEDWGGSIGPLVLARAPMVPFDGVTPGRLPTHETGLTF